MTREADLKAYKLGSDIISESSYVIQENTGCSDWANVTTGTMQTADSALDCLNKCLVIDGAKYANYQSDTCSAENGAYVGACYCFTDCTKIPNTCWDLISTQGMTTNLDEPVAAGATSVNVGSTAGLAVGSTITFSGGGNSETKTVVGFASILLDSPLQFSYPAGSTISARPSGSIAAMPCR